MGLLCWSVWGSDLGFGCFFFPRRLVRVRRLDMTWDDLGFYYTITIFTVLTEISFISGGLG